MIGSKHLRKKKAQITVFMIIGVVLLFSSALVLYIRGQVQEAEIEEISVPAVQELPLELKPLGAYIGNCIEEVGREALTILMQKGGNLYTEEDNNLVSTIQDPIDADMLSLSTTGSFNIPYWFYDKNGQQIMRFIPDLEKSFLQDDSIEGQLGRYVDEHIEGCLRDFGPLTNQFEEVTATGDPSTNAVVTRESVIFTLNYPIEIRKGGVLSSADIFQADIMVGLRSMYDLANSIASFEIFTTFLEDISMDMIEKYSRNEPGALPPLAGGSQPEDCSVNIIWPVSMLPPLADNVMKSTIPYLRINNTNFRRITVGGSGRPQRTRQRVMDHFIFQVSPESYPNLRVSFMPMNLVDFKINGKDRGTLEGEKILELNILSFMDLCFNEYTFRYSFQYPVIIRVEDLTPNRESVFQFPMEVVIKDNKPRLPRGPGSSIDFGEQEDEAFRNEVSCSEGQRTIPITVNVTDMFTEAAIEKAVVNYQCGPMGAECRLGYTNKQGFLETKAPVCIGGIFNIEKQPSLGGVPTHLKMVRRGDVIAPVNFTFELSPLFEVPFEIEKRTLDVFNQRKYREKIKDYEEEPDADYNPCEEEDEDDWTDDIRRFCNKLGEEGSDSWTSYVYEDEDEDTIINLSKVLPICVKVGESSTGAKDAASIDYHKLDLLTGILEPEVPAGYTKGGNNTILLAIGNFTVDIKLFQKTKKIFSANSQSITYENEDGDDETKYYPEEDTESENPVTGGSQFTLEVTKDDLLLNKTLVFTVYDEGEPTVIEQIGEAMIHYPICQEQLGEGSTKPKWV